MADFIQVEAGTEVYVVDLKGVHSKSKAAVTGFQKKAIHKQHKTGKIVLEEGRDATKFSHDSTGLRWATWSARRLSGRSVWDRGGERYIVPVDEKSTAFLKDQKEIILAERRASAAADGIDEKVQSMRNEGNAADVLERALAVLGEYEPKA